MQMGKAPTCATVFLEDPRDGSHNRPNTFSHAGGPGGPLNCADRLRFSCNNSGRIVGSETTVSRIARWMNLPKTELLGSCPISGVGSFAC
jgi:hypothetical protein